MTQVGLLLGNTSLRYCIFCGGAIVDAGSLCWAELAAGGFQRLREIVARAESREVLVGSVRDDRLDELLSLLPGCATSFAVAGRDFPIPIENAYENPAEAGSDRLLNALAGRELWPGCAVAVLDFGTAFSVSVVSRDGAFAGGLIAPGAGSALAALRDATPRLPPVTLGSPAGFLKANTVEALRAGIYWSLVGAAERIIEGLRAELGKPLYVVVTGGDAELLAPGLRGTDRIDPHLTLQGLRLAAAARAGGERAEA
jgi:pantothenate kinase type III